jgi:Poly(ADP-ribose) polymerase catalytic domain
MKIPIELSDKLFDEITAKIRKSYPNACVLYIDEIINYGLLEAYENRKSKMPTARELQLFHGTKSSNISSIIENGFKTEYNRTSAYGIGTYFSVYANYSKNFTNIDKGGISYIFLCDVLVGECERTRGGTPIRKDNSVDDLLNPTMYVTPYDDACYPRYLVAFHKNAT